MQWAGRVIINKRISGSNSYLVPIKWRKHCSVWINLLCCHKKTQATYLLINFCENGHQLVITNSEEFDLKISHWADLVQKLNSKMEYTNCIISHWWFVYRGDNSRGFNDIFLSTSVAGWSKICHKPANIRQKILSFDKELSIFLIGIYIYIYIYM